MTDLQGLATLFHDLCELSTGEQQDRLAALEDPEVRTRLAALLEADRVASRVMRTGAGQDTLLVADLARDVLPERIGAFRILGRLGAGAMGVVYDAEQEHPRRRVALKQPHPWLHTDVALELFRFEAQALGQVSHPCIPVVYEAGDAEGRAYLSMERVDGVPLLAWVARDQPGLEARIEILRRIAEAVGAAHQAGLVHRDLKPDNVLVTADGTPKLLDFGVAAPLLGSHGESQPGTPVYMSPEQLRGEPVDARSDVHALGTIAYQLLTGSLPVQGRTRAELLAEKAVLPVRADTVQPALDPDIGRVIERALAPRAADRPVDAGAWSVHLARAAAALPLEWMQADPVYRGRRFLRRNRRWLLPMGGLLAAGVLLLGGLQGARTWREAQRLQVADARLERALSRASTAVAADRWGEAEQIVVAFVEDPEHADTPARARAWLWWADQLGQEQRGEGGAALAEAWLAAPDRPTVDEVTRALAERFQDASRHTALWRLQEVLSPEVRDGLTGPLRQAAIARRDLDGLRALPGPDEPLLEALLTGTPVGRGQRAGWADSDRDGVPEMFVIRRDATELFDLHGRERLGVLPQPGDAGWLNRRLYQPWDGALWVATEEQGGRFVRAERTPDGLAVEPVGALVPGRLLDVELAHTPAGPRFLIGLGYPARRLLAVDPANGALSTVHPGTDALESDVMSVLAADLDADGDQELVVALGAWKADEVRVLTPEGDGYRLAGRLPLGTVEDLELLPRPDGPPLILASKVDLEPNLRLYGPEAPFGPEPGMYLLEWTGEALEQRRFLPYPIADGLESGPERSADYPALGDFDGDGRTDLVSTLRHFDVGFGDAVWVVADVLGEARSYVIGGMQAHSAADVDGDGDTELLVAEDDETLWLLGLGTQRLPILEPKEHTLTLGPPPSADPVVRRGWTRAQQLVDLGLAEEGVHALSVLPALAERPDVRAAADTAAAGILEQTGRPAEAAELYARALAAAANDGSGALPTEPIAAGLARTRVASLQLDEAAAVARAHPTPELPWLQDLPPSRSLLEPDLEGWIVERPDVFRRSARGLEVDVFNDHGVLARRPVRITGGAASLDLKVRIDQLELGSGLRVEVVGGPHRRELMVALWGQGGGGATRVWQHCGAAVMEHLAAYALQAPLDLRLVAGVFAEQGLRCRSDSRTRDVYKAMEAEPVPPGDYELRITAHGVADYFPPTRMRGVIEALEGVGLEPLPTTPDAAAAARLALHRGEVPEQGAREDAAWWALAAGDERALTRALGDLWARGDRQRLRWLLRTHGDSVVPPLQSLLGRDFAALFLEAYREAGGPGKRTSAVAEELLRPSSTALPLDAEGAQTLWLWRAQIRMERGERAHARSLARTLLESGPDPAVREQARALLAETR